MPLAGYNVVLGTKWPDVRRPIVWDLARRRISFEHEGHTVCRQGVALPIAPRLQATVVVATDALFDGLLGAFANIFAERTGLPPARGHDHRINLKPDASPMAMRPYMYLVAHKNELERQCATMIEQAIVRRCDSPFSSPVLLVKKPDGSWRFCVDYRALNELTVKDAFSISVVDELHGTSFFTKLDLRSGYHQVWMRPGDVHKIAFRSHDGLYEFLVMVFGLCNTPATFQALMNDVLRLFLRRFVLVFFDQPVSLDYSSDHKGYECLDLSSNRLLIPRHVVFDEDSFSLAASSRLTNLDFLYESGSSVSTIRTTLADIIPPHRLPCLHNGTPRFEPLQCPYPHL
jgi:hypothetical protein